jgi:hypothetical protein
MRSFFAICHSSPCTAKNERGQACTGIPKFVKFKNVCIEIETLILLKTLLITSQNAIKNGHRHFISCSSWSHRFSEGHRTSYIPSGVKDEHLEVLFSGENLPDFEEPFSCGRIVPAYIGSRISHCSKSELFVAIFQQ